MTKLLVTSDLHFDDKPENEYRYKIVPVLLKEIEKDVPDALIIAGDLTDKKDKHSAKMLWRVLENMKQLSEYTDVYILRGNHDCLSPDTPFFGFLDEIEGIDFIIEPEEVVIGTSSVLFLPHSRNPEEDWKEIGLEGFDYIFLHQTFTGAKAETGKKMEGASFARFRDLDAICVSGDIHVPQRIGPITYCGAPYPVRFGDKFDPRLLLLNGKKKKSIKVSIMNKHSLTISDPEDIYDIDAKEGDQAVVYLDLPKSEVMEWEEHRRRTKEICSELGIRLAGVSLLRRPESVSEEKRVEPTTVGLEEIFDQCCDRWDTDGTVREVGRGLIEEYLE